MAKLWIDKTVYLKDNNGVLETYPIKCSSIEVPIIDMGGGATGASEVSITSSLITGTVSIKSPVSIDHSIAGISKLYIDENYV